MSMESPPTERPRLVAGLVVVGLVGLGAILVGPAELASLGVGTVVWLAGFAYKAILALLVSFIVAFLVLIIGTVSFAVVLAVGRAIRMAHRTAVAE